jgi:N-acyl-phosphatidylethanolamine-hydrolysing phospholipase D
LRIEDLPEIDIVLISHNHYDHLDRNTIEFLGNKPMYLVPLGVGEFFEALEITRYEEFDWWDTIKINTIEFICTPAQHFSGRNLFDSNKTLWCGWILKDTLISVYFAGDTGYFPVFKEIGEKFGPIDLAAMPIGSYEPRWYMEPVHMNPEQAVDAYLDVKARYFIPIHWGTFNLGEEPIYEPATLLRREIKKRKLDENLFWILKHGETKTGLGTNTENEPTRSKIQLSENEF